MKVHKFKPDIYPVTIYVLEDPTYKEAVNKFIFYNDDDVPVSLQEYNWDEFINSSYAMVFPISEKGSNDLGIAFCPGMQKIKDISGSTIAHESVHIADKIFEDLGIVAQSFKDSNEPYAYLVGYIFKCIESVKIKSKQRKVKNKKDIK